VFLLLKNFLFWSQAKIVYPLETLNLCDAYDYIELANDVAPLTLFYLSHSLEKVAAVLTHPGLLAKWVKKNFAINQSSTHELPFDLAKILSLLA